MRHEASVMAQIPMNNGLRWPKASIPGKPWVSHQTIGVVINIPTQKSYGMVTCTGVEYTLSCLLEFTPVAA